MLQTFGATSIVVPDEFAEFIIHSRDVYLRQWLAGHGNCKPEWMADLLLHDTSNTVRRIAAESKFTAEVDLAVSAGTEEDLFVLERVARNRNTSAASLHTIVNRVQAMNVPPAGRNKHVMGAIAWNNNARPDTLSILHHTYPKVRNVEDGLAQNSNTPPEVLKAIYQRNARGVVGLAQQSVLLCLARNPSSSGDVVFGCLTHQKASSLMRKSAGKHANLAGDLLQQAVDSPVSGVRAAVAANPNLTAGQVETLCNDPQQQVRAVALARPDVPAAVLLHAAQRRGTSALCAIAGHVNTPPEVLIVLASHQDEPVRQAALDNPNCPPEGQAAAWLCN